MHPVTFHDHFSAIARQFPHRPALVWQGEPLSYAQLDQKSSLVAAELSASGIGVGDIVPLHQPCDADFLVGALGILKTGAAYAPISMNTPPERLSFLLDDLRTKANPTAFCVYYTSGSTGRPKGVVLSHAGVLSLCETHVNLCSFAAGIRAAVQADVGFDSFLLSTMPVLYCGGTLYLMDATERLSLIGIHRFLMKNRIDTVFLTTQLAVEYMRSLDNPRLGTLLTGGEAIHAHTPRSYAVYNLYGPTEVRDVNGELIFENPNEPHVAVKKKRPII